MSTRISLRALAGAVITTTVIAAAVTPAGAQQDLGRNETTWRWDGQVGNGQWLRVYNVNGAMHVTASGDGNVHVHAEKRVRSGGDPTTVHFAVTRDGEGVTVCALWSNDATCEADGSHNNDIHTGQWDRRQNVEVTFDVQVPAGVRAAMNTVNGELTITRVTGEVRARTVNGGVEVRDVGAAVNAGTVNGDISINTRGGPVSAETVNGSIDATMASQGSSDMRFRSVNGNIDINAPDALNADVELSTVNGSIDSKFPLSYDRRHRHAEGNVGRGGPRLAGSTVNGSITLH